jgi:general secretion pathway protein H
MPTLGIGRSTAEWRALRRHAGFTLLELLLACLIVGILAATLSFAIPGRGSHLAFEADRLARLFVLAREEAMLRSAPVRFDGDLDGFRFLVWRDRRWQLPADEPLLRARAWEAPTQISVERVDAVTVIEFGREPLDLPFKLHLRREQMSAVIESDGLGTFTVR